MDRWCGSKINIPQAGSLYFLSEQGYNHRVKGQEVPDQWIQVQMEFKAETKLNYNVYFYFIFSKIPKLGSHTTQAGLELAI